MESHDTSFLHLPRAWPVRVSQDPPIPLAGNKLAEIKDFNVQATRSMRKRGLLPATRGFEMTICRRMHTAEPQDHGTERGSAEHCAQSICRHVHADDGHVFMQTCAQPILYSWQ